MDPFALLGVPPQASPAEIKAAYRAAARTRHPDAGGDEQSFQELSSALELALEYASGERTNPYLPRDDHTLYVSHYDRHRHSPPPPPNVWSNRFLGGALFWIVPVVAGIFMLSGATGPYFLPVFVGSMAVFGIVVWLIVRR